MKTKTDNREDESREFRGKGKKIMWENIIDIENRTLRHINHCLWRREQNKWDRILHYGIKEYFQTARESVLCWRKWFTPSLPNQWKETHIWAHTSRTHKASSRRRHVKSETGCIHFLCSTKCSEDTEAWSFADDIIFMYLEIVIEAAEKNSQN